MKRCKICRGSDDVRGDGICRGCYDLRQANLRGMTYGKYIQAFGHNLERPGEEPGKPPKICAVCGAPLSSTRRKYCSRRCTRAAWWRKRKEKQA